MSFLGNKVAPVDNDIIPSLSIASPSIASVAPDVVPDKYTVNKNDDGSYTVTKALSGGRATKRSKQSKPSKRSKSKKSSNKRRNTKKMY